MKQSDAAVQTKPYNLDANQTMIGLGMSLEPIMRSGKNNGDSPGLNHGRCIESEAISTQLLSAN